MLFSSDGGHLLAGLAYQHEVAENLFEVLEVHLVRAVAHGMIRVLVYFHEYAGYADGRRDYEIAWNTATDSKDETGKAGMGRTDSIWNELNVIGVTDGIYNDTVAVTTANADIYNPEFINALQTALINIINTEEGKAIFNVYSHTGYAIATDADYNGARTALTAVQ